MVNYFELYEIPVQLSVDPALIRKKFHALSRQYHPDRFGDAADNEQADILEKSAQVNRGYKIFSQGDETIKYALQLKGFLEEEEKYQLSPDFLMEMLELNEEVVDAAGDPEKMEGLKTRINELETQLYEEVKQVVENYQEDITTEKELLRVKEYYYRKKYLHRILAGIQ